MREVAVQAHADAEPGDQVEGEGDHDIVPAEAPSPGQRHGGDDREQRDGDEHADQDTLEGAAGLVLDVWPGADRSGYRRCGPGAGRRPGVNGCGHWDPRWAVAVLHE